MRVRHNFRLSRRVANEISTGYQHWRKQACGWCGETMVDSLGPVAGSRVQSKKMTPTDALVGQRIKFRRRLVGLSLEELAARLQIAPQQLQKYESAHNRVTAGRLLALADILEVPIQWFFERQVEDNGVAETSERGTRTATDPTVPPDQLAEAIRLFASLGDANVRAHCLDMLRLLQRTKCE